MSAHPQSEGDGDIRVQVAQRAEGGENDSARAGRRGYYHFGPGNGVWKLSSGYCISSTPGFAACFSWRSATRTVRIHIVSRCLYWRFPGKAP